MKIVYKMMFLFLLTGSIPLSSAFGQEKKNEQKIKVIIADESGTKTVIDTTLTGNSMPETITLKNGKVIFIGKPGTSMSHKESTGGKENVIVTVTSDEDGEKRKEERIIIMSSDSVEWTLSSIDKGRDFYVYSHSESKDGKPLKHITTASAGAGYGTWADSAGKKVIIIKDIKEKVGKNGKTFDIIVEPDDMDTDTDVTKYVVAKDGIVVTVECNDEARAKELIKEIESKLDVKSEQEGNKEVVKTETKKIIKK
ncbi:MAG: hypothetical protein MUO72_00195 [Bacteroidales bacterium]|nr:hypothetical protein [Bacteroidales bacterium]